MKGFPCSRCEVEAPPHDHTCLLVNAPPREDEYSDRLLSRGKDTHYTGRLTDGFYMLQDDEDTRDERSKGDEPCLD